MLATLKTRLTSMLGLAIAASPTAQEGDPTAERVQALEVAPPPTIGEEIGQVVTAVTNHLTGALSYGRLFDPQSGRFAHGQIFKFNRVSMTNLINRLAVLKAIASAPIHEIQATPLPVRAGLFALIKQETKRYNGTAVRSRDSEFGKKGDPLPKLQFPTPRQAVEYRQALEKAFARLVRGITP